MRQVCTAVEHSLHYTDCIHQFNKYLTAARFVRNVGLQGCKELPRGLQIARALKRLTVTKSGRDYLEERPTAGSNSKMYREHKFLLLKLHCKLSSVPSVV